MEKEHSISIRGSRRASDIRLSGWIVEHFIDSMYVGSISPSAKREKEFFALLDNHGLTDEYFTLLVKEQGTLKGWPGDGPVGEWVTAHFRLTGDNSADWSCVHDEWLKLNFFETAQVSETFHVPQFEEQVFYSPVFNDSPSSRLFGKDPYSLVYGKAHGKFFAATPMSIDTWDITDLKEAMVWVRCQRYTKYNGFSRGGAIDPRVFSKASMACLEAETVYSPQIAAYGKFFDIAKNGVKEILVVTPDTARRSHAVFSFSPSNSAILVQFFEAATTSSEGSPTLAKKRSRNIANESTAAVYEDPTVAGTGRLVSSCAVESGRSSGDEIILKQNTKYLIRITEAGMLSTTVNWKLDWIELTNMAGVDDYPSPVGDRDSRGEDNSPARIDDSVDNSIVPPNLWDRGVKYKLYRGGDEYVVFDGEQHYWEDLNFRKTGRDGNADDIYFILFPGGASSRVLKKWLDEHLFEKVDRGSSGEKDNIGAKSEEDRVWIDVCDEARFLVTRYSKELLAEVGRKARSILDSPNASISPYREDDAMRRAFARVVVADWDGVTSVGAKIDFFRAETVIADLPELYLHLFDAWVRTSIKEDRDSNGEEDFPAAENKEDRGCNAEGSSFGGATTDEVASGLKRVSMVMPSLKDLYPDADHAIAREDAHIKARRPVDTIKKAMAMSSVFGNEPWFKEHLTRFDAKQKAEVYQRLLDEKKISVNGIRRAEGHDVPFVVGSAGGDSWVKRYMGSFEDGGLARCGVDVAKPGSDKTTATIHANGEIYEDNLREAIAPQFKGGSFDYAIVDDPAFHRRVELTPDMMSEEFKESCDMIREEFRSKCTPWPFCTSQWRFLAKLVPCVFGAIAGTMILAVICTMVMVFALWLFNTWMQGSLITVFGLLICYSLYRVFLYLWGKG